jgi:hypothetical protein
LEKHSVSIFIADVAMLGSGKMYVGSEEEQAGGNGPVRVEE